MDACPIPAELERSGAKPKDKPCTAWNGSPPGSGSFWLFDPSECPSGDASVSPSLIPGYKPPCDDDDYDPETGMPNNLPDGWPTSRVSSPLILDLDGDGVETDGVTYFDHEGDGWNELTRWANEDDGVLVWDRNSDGVINDGSELFGNNTELSNGNKAKHGFVALAELDSNNDGVVDASDAKWSELRIMRWTDANDDGMMQDNEKSLVTLDSLGITSLNTEFTNSDHVDAKGNEHRQVGSFTQTVDGSEVTRTMTDVWFVSDESRSIYDDSDIPEHSKAIEKLPDIAGGGRVYSLRDAMALDDATDTNGIYNCTILVN